MDLCLVIEFLHLIFIPIFGIGIVPNICTKKDSKLIIKIVSVIFLIFLILFGIFGIVKCDKSGKASDKIYTVENIVALADNNMMNGKVYLGSGQIDEDLYYQYMAKLNDGGFVANKVKADDTTIYYTDSNYRVEWHERRKRFLYFEKVEKYKKIYVPEGSMSNNYLIDLQ